MIASLKRTTRKHNASFSLACLLMVLAPSAFAQSLPTLVTPRMTAVQLGQPYDAIALIGGTPAPTTVTFSAVPAGLTATHLGGGRVRLSGAPTGAARVANLIVTATNSVGTANLTLPIEVAEWTVVPRNLLSIGAGAAHTCAVIGGGVQCWGFNGSGQLGNGTTASSVLPIQTIPANSGATQVSAGPTFSCAVVAGGVKCWGDNLRVGGSSVLGTGTTTGSTLPVQTIAAGSGATQVSAGRDHACAVINGGLLGTAKCWGANGSGQLGRGNTTGSLVPVDVVSIGGVTAIAAGPDFTCAVVNGATPTTASARCWGNNSVGQLGNSTNGGQSTSPVQALSMTRGVTAIAVGDRHACAVQSGGVFCWGANELGQLGDNQGRPGFSNVPVLAITSSSGVAAVSAGLNTSCASYNNGGGSVGVRCWGAEYVTGLRQIAPRFVFTDAVTTPILSVGGSHTCATRNGVVQCWGLSGAGQLGLGEVTVLTPTVTNRFSNSAIETISVSQIATGANHTCAVVNGAARCIGSNETNQHFLSASVTTPQVATGTGFSCAIVDGGVRCIGAINLGQIGNTGSSSSTVPFQTVAANSGATAVAANEQNGCAVVAGGVRCWGPNASGQLGNGNTNATIAPVQTIAAGSGATAVAVGWRHACAVVSGGIRCWGDNNSGELGNGRTDRTGASTPVQTLPEGSGATAIAAGMRFSCAVISGSVRCWGLNTVGQLGDASTTARTSPVTTIAATEGATAVTAGANHACAIVSGGLRCWGANRFGSANNIDAEGRERVGILGNGSRVAESLIPVNVIPSGSNVNSVSGGLNQTCATVNGSALCWGDNSSNKLGLGIGIAPSPFNNRTAFPINVRFSAADAAGVGLTVAAGAGGTISPSGAVSVPNGTSQTFTITPNAGFILTRPSGTCQGRLNGTVYMLTNVTAPCTLNASFQAIAANHHVVTASIGEGEEFGDVAPGQQAVLNGSLNAFAAIIAHPTGTHAVSLTTGGTCAAGPTASYASIGARVEFNTSRGRTGDCTVILNFRRGTTAQTLTFPQPSDRVAGTSFNLSATASSGDPVLFEVSFATRNICQVNSPSNLLTTLSAGVCTVVAIQPGDATFAPSASIERSFTVTPSAVVRPTLSLNSTKSPTTLNEAFTLVVTAIGTTPVGTVTFSVLGQGGVSTVICPSVALSTPTGSGATASATANCVVPATARTFAKHVYTATLVSSGVALASARWNQQITGTLANVTLAAAPVKPNTAQALELTAVISGVLPSGTVRFSSDGQDIANCTTRPVQRLSTSPGFDNVGVASCPVAAGTFAAGTRVLMVTYTGDTNNGATSATINLAITPQASGPTVDYTDLWWAGQAENGWGMSISQRGNVQFNAFYIYDSAGRPTWMVMPGGSWNANFTTFTGDLYSPTGAPFSAYNPASFVVGGIKGSASINFIDANNATLTYNITSAAGNGSGAKTISRQVFGAVDPSVRLIVNGLWWNAAENGWGIAINQQARTLFATWYTYGADGKATWLVMPGGSWNGNVFSGDLYTTTGSPWIGTNYNPATLAVNKVGTVVFDFADADAASMTYTIGDVTQTKLIVRQPY